MKESASRDLLPAHHRKCVSSRGIKGRALRMGTVGHPCMVKSFRKAVSAVMDDLELINSIIEQLAPVN